MSFSFTGNPVTVGTTPGVLLRFRPRELASCVIKPIAAITIGSEGLSSTRGLPLDAGQPFGFSHQDFSSEMLKENAEVVIYAVAAVATTARVALLAR